MREREREKDQQRERERPTERKTEKRREWERKSARANTQYVRFCLCQCLQPHGYPHIVFLVEAELGQRIFPMGVEPGRYDQQLRTKAPQGCVCGEREKYTKEETKKKPH